MSANRCKNLRWKLGLKNCLAVDSDGLSGGLVLFWDENINVSLLRENDISMSWSALTFLKPLGGQLLFMVNPTSRTGERCGSCCVLYVGRGLDLGW